MVWVNKLISTAGSQTTEENYEFADLSEFIVVPELPFGQGRSFFLLVVVFFSLAILGSYVRFCTGISFICCYFHFVHYLIQGSNIGSVLLEKKGSTRRYWSKLSRP